LSLQDVREVNFDGLIHGVVTTKKIQKTEPPCDNVVVVENSQYLRWASDELLEWLTGCGGNELILTSNYPHLLKRTLRFVGGSQVVQTEGWGEKEVVEISKKIVKGRLNVEHLLQLRLFPGFVKYYGVQLAWGFSEGAVWKNTIHYANVVLRHQIMEYLFSIEDDGFCGNVFTVLSRGPLGDVVDPDVALCLEGSGLISTRSGSPEFLDGVVKLALSKG
jgi:hypothetical protein